jgi:putative tryptophan/tyrosine transport system substrate-binding protein
MKRRKFLTLLGGAAAWPLMARAQQGERDKQIRIGFLAAAVPTAAMLRAFRDALREHGYVEGQNLSIADRWPQGSSEQTSDIAAELVRSNVDIIVAWTTPASLAAKAATPTIPIVMVGVGDPVGTGLVRSLARPGGNITGFVNLAPDLSAKQVQLLIEVIPEIRRVGIVRNPSNPAVALALREVEKAIRVLGLEFHTVDARLPQEFESAFARLSAEGVKGVIVVADASVIEHRSMIAALAQKTRLPTMFQRRENVAAGGLMSYGPDLPDQLRQAASYVDRILKGTKPTDLPVQQATKIELVINLKTAKALGLTIPPTLLGLADEVIE